jgi:hypothetical protein
MKPAFYLFIQLYEVKNTCFLFCSFQ